MESSAEERFVRQFVRKRHRERLLHELTSPKKRYRGLDRFCHGAYELVDPALVVMEGEDLERSAAFAQFAQANSELCDVLSPDPNLDGLRLPLAEAAALSAMGTDAAIVLGGDFAVVFGEAERGGRTKLLLKAR